MLKRRLLCFPAQDSIDYNRDALQGVNWLSGYRYNQKTGILEEKANQYASEKFHLQNCLYALSHKSTGSYLGIYMWDSVGRFVRFTEINSGTLYILPGENDYVFAVVFYDTNGNTTDSISLLPVDNRNTAKTFEINFEDLKFSPFMMNAYNGYAEMNLKNIAGYSSYISDIAHTNYPLIDRASTRFFGANAFPEECLCVQNWNNQLILQTFNFGADAEAANSYFKTVPPLKVWI